mmetsp:Transcript_4712/g.8883  ORF Transcript_4712/g.8883 Transcript_4712/m.8883 type:complete len:1027 (+) Transcript_4712:246-3326(+)
MALCAISHAHISRVNVSPARKNAYSNTRSDSFPHAPIPSAAQRCVRPLDVKCRRSWPRFQPKGGRSASPPPPRSSVHGGASVSESFGDFDLVASNNSPAISFPTGSARNASTIVSKVVGAPSKKGSKDVEKTGTGGDGRVLRRTFRSTIMGGKGVRRRWPLRMGDFESPQKAMGLQKAQDPSPTPTNTQLPKPSQSVAVIKQDGLSKTRSSTTKAYVTSSKPSQTSKIRQKPLDPNVSSIEASKSKADDAAPGCANVGKRGRSRAGTLDGDLSASGTENVGQGNSLAAVATRTGESSKPDVRRRGKGTVASQSVARSEDGEVPAHELADGTRIGAAGDPVIDPDTGEMIFVWERFGEGWGEQILPSFSVKRQQTLPNHKNKVEQAFDSTKAHMAERLGWEPAYAGRVMDEAASWRTTKKGRSLVDRKLRKIVTTNAPDVLDLLMGVYLLDAQKTSSLLRKYVALLTVSPTDDWAGNYVEYLLRSQTLIAPGFDIAKAFDAAEQSGAGRLLGFRPVKPIEEWVEWQQRMKTQGRLGEKRIVLLELAGMEWGIMDNEWEERFDDFVSFRLYHGDADVEIPQRRAPKQLVEWVQKQREYYLLGLLPQKGVERLQLLDMDLDPIPAAWLHSYQELKAFVERFGNSKVDAAGAKYAPLSAWLQEQCELQCSASLSPKRALLLQEIGVEWDAYSSVQWDMRFAQLEEFHEKYGHGNVSKTWVEMPGLGQWVEEQRQEHAQARLAPDRKQRLEALGVDMTLVEDEWEQLFRMLAAFRQEHGHCEVPRKHAELGEWIATQRAMWRDSLLPAHRAARLDEIGFVWDHTQAEWERRYNQLSKFKEAYGHCSVPQKYQTMDEASVGLGMWVSLQRRLKKEDRLLGVRATALDTLGFEWEGARAREEREKIEADFKGPITPVKICRAHSDPKNQISIGSTRSEHYYGDVEAGYSDVDAGADPLAQARTSGYVNDGGSVPVEVKKNPVQEEKACSSNRKNQVVCDENNLSGSAQVKRGYSILVESAEPAELDADIRVWV